MRRVVAVVHGDGGHRIRALAGFRDIETEHLSLGPDRDRAADRFGQQSVAQKGVFESFGKQHVQGLAQGEQQVHRGSAGIFPVMLGAVALGPVPVGGSQPGGLMDLSGAVIGGDETEARWRHQALL